MAAAQAAAAKSVTPPESPYASTNDNDNEAEAEGSAPQPAISSAQAAGTAHALGLMRGGPSVHAAAQGPWPSAAVEVRTPARISQAWLDAPRAAGGAAAAAAQARIAAAALAWRKLAMWEAEQACYRMLGHV